MNYGQTSNVGFALFAGFRLPIGLSATKETPLPADYDILNPQDGIIGTDMSFGVISRFSVSSDGNVKGRVFLGPHFYYLSAAKKQNGIIQSSLTKFNMGLNGSIGIEYHFSGKIYLFSRIDMIFDFITFATLHSHTNDQYIYISNNGSDVYTYNVFKTVVPVLVFSAPVMLGIGIKL